MNIVNEQQPANLWVEFYQDAEHSIFQSEAKGYPVFIDKIFCKIVIPGEVQNIVVHEVKGQRGEELKRHYPQQWAAFQQGIETPLQGFPLVEWNLPRSQVETLKAMRFRTVEDLSTASDLQLQNIMGGYELRSRAKAFLDRAKDSAATEKLAADNARLQAQIDDLKAQIAAIGEPKRGRRAQPEG